MPDDFEIESPSKRRRFSTIVKLEEIKEKNPKELILGEEFDLTNFISNILGLSKNYFNENEIEKYYSSL